MRKWFVLSLLSLAALLLTACAIQPIQPIQPLPAPAEAPPAADPSLGTGAPVHFATAGLTVTVPAGWIARHEPNVTALILRSAPPSEAEQQLHFMHEFWPYISGEAQAVVLLANEKLAIMPVGTVSEWLLYRYRTRMEGGSINTLGVTTEVEPPSELEINGQPALRALIQGTDPALLRDYLARVWAVQGGDRVVFVSCPLLPENEAAFLPVCEQIAASVVVGVPGPAPEPPMAITGRIEPGAPVSATLPAPPLGEIVRHYWQFEGKAGTRYTVIVDPEGAIEDPMMAVLDAAGAPVVDEVDVGGDGATEMARFTVPADGEYIVMVRMFFQGPGMYTLALKEIR